MLTDYAPGEGIIVTGGYGIREAVGRTTVGRRKHSGSARINTNVPAAIYHRTTATYQGTSITPMINKQDKNVPLTAATALHRVQP